MKDPIQEIVKFVSENIEKHTQKEVLVALDKYFDQTEWSLEKEEFEKMNRDEKRDLAKTILNNLESEEVTLEEAQEEDEQAFNELQQHIEMLQEQLTVARDKMRELKGDPKPTSKIELARDYMELNPGLVRKDYIAAFIEIGFGKAYAATAYQKLK